MIQQSVQLAVREKKMSPLDKILEEVKIERQRQADVAGSEYDLVNTPNDWVAIASHYLLQDVYRKKVVPNRAQFHDSLVKAAAVIVAALEYEQNMTTKGHLTD